MEGHPSMRKKFDKPLTSVPIRGIIFLSPSITPPLWPAVSHAAGTLLTCPCKKFWKKFSHGS